MIRIRRAPGRIFMTGRFVACPRRERPRSLDVSSVYHAAPTRTRLDRNHGPAPERTGRADPVAWLLERSQVGDEILEVSVVEADLFHFGRGPRIYSPQVAAQTQQIGSFRQRAKRRRGGEATVAGKIYSVALRAIRLSYRTPARPGLALDRQPGNGGASSQPKEAGYRDGPTRRPSCLAVDRQ